MHQQLWGYKVEEKLYGGVREHKMLNTAGVSSHQPTVRDTLHLAKVQVNTGTPKCNG